MNFKNMIAKRNRTRKNNKSKTSQRGGVGFKLDVTSCPIGGRPPVVPTSDCPHGVGPGSTNFANALYGGKRRNNNRRCGKQQKIGGYGSTKRKAKCGYNKTKSKLSCRASRK